MDVYRQLSDAQLIIDILVFEEMFRVSASSLINITLAVLFTYSAPCYCNSLVYGMIV